MALPFRIPRKRRFVGLLVLSGLVVFGLAGFLVHAQRSRAREALLRYEAELRGQGEKLTYADLLSGQPARTPPFSAGLTAAIAKLGGARYAPGGLPLRDYVAPGRARALWQADAERSRQLKWDWDAFGHEVDARQEALAKIREAVADPALAGGPRSNLMAGIPIGNLVQLRTAAQWFMGATLSDLRRARLEEASQDLAALGCMGKVHRDEHYLVAQMIRVAIRRLGAGVIWEALQAPDWTEPQLGRIQDAFEGDDPMDGLEKALVGERVCILELRELSRRDPSAARAMMVSVSAALAPGSGPSLSSVFEQGVIEPLYHWTSADADELLFLRKMQTFLEVLREVRAGKSWPVSKPQVAGTTASRKGLAGKLDQFRRPLSAGPLTLNLIKATEVLMQGEAELQLARAALAIRRYQLRHGKLPEALRDLTPEFLSTPPRDPMSPGSLVYRPKPDGTFLLYSVGLDGRDDGGDPTPAAGKPPSLWEGWDAVWPEAEAPVK